MATKTKVTLMKKPAVKTAEPVEVAEEQATETVEEVAAPAAKTTTKIKAKPAAAAETAEDDLIVKVAHEVENLKEEKALALVPTLLDNIDRDGFRLGGVLSKVQAEGWFMNTGHETFKSWVEASTGIAYRKAMYLVNIYNQLVGSGIPYEKVKGLGWTKLKELAPIISTENVDEWVALAENCTVLQLIEHIKQATKGEDENESTEEEAVKTTTTMTFKVHEDQKATITAALEKAKHAINTDVSTVALEAMAMDYLGGKSKAAKIPSLKELMSKKDPGDILNTFNELFPNIYIQAQVFDTAEEAQAAQAAAEAAEAEEAAS